ncbi:MAG: flavin reductase family protein [Anaerolineaceae bacterium]|nr:flavin reductase family protein [Anaerolineaceae bacterium]
MPLDGEALRQVMRRWPTGVTVVTSRSDNYCHGMTVNSFASLSLDPPYVSVSLARESRTYALVKQSGVFGINILGEDDGEISDRFAGKISEPVDRFAGLETFTLVTGVPLLILALANLDCRVAHQYAMPNSTLFVGEVMAVKNPNAGWPLVYLNRGYHKIEK